MVLRVDVVAAALDAVYGGVPEHRVVALTPQGRQLDQEVVEELAGEERLTLLSARFEGFDERILTHLCSDAISIGPYVLSGGELPAMVVVDAIARLPAGRARRGLARERETFSAELDGGLEYPALHAAGRVPRLARPGRARSPATTPGSRTGAASRAARGAHGERPLRRSRGRAAGVRTTRSASAYHSRRRFHFDAVETPEGIARMRELREAYEVLSDPDRRRSYDASRSGTDGPPPFAHGDQPPQPFAYGAPTTTTPSSRPTGSPTDPDSLDRPRSRTRGTRSTALTRDLPRGWRIAIDWVVTIVGAIAIVLAIKAWVVNPYRIPSSSMEPTLHCARPGSGCEARFSDRVLANRFIYHFREPARAATSSSSRRRRVAQETCGAGGTFVKRLIGLPGETVSGEERLRLHQRQEAERAVHQAGPPRHRNVGAGEKIPTGQYFMMGDNRTQSCDSREWGTVPRGNLIGKVFASTGRRTASASASVARAAARFRYHCPSAPRGRSSYEQRPSRLLEQRQLRKGRAAVQGGRHRPRALPGDRGPAPPRSRSSRGS